MAVLIHGPPEVVSLATDREEHLVQMPLVARPGAPMPELIRIRPPNSGWLRRSRSPRGRR
jgi:hypothetical protein